MEQQQEENQPPQILPTEQQDQPSEEAQEPTKSVKNFWERLDEVFLQNNQLKERMDELVEQFPDFQKAQGEFKSFVFQPERIALCSNDDITPSSAQADANPLRVPSEVVGHYPSEKFSSFRIRLKRPLRNVKSIQLLSAVVPNAVQNIPDNQTFFFFYKIRPVSIAYQGDWTIGYTYYPGDLITYVGNVYVLNTTDTAAAPAPPDLNPSYTLSSFPNDLASPNYYDMNSYRLKYIRLQPTFDRPFESTAAVNGQLLFNRTFEDYNDIVNSLNTIVGLNQVLNNCLNDVTFQYDAQLNKIIMIPNAAEIATGYFYLPCGYEDPNIAAFMANPNQIIYGIGNAFAAPAFKFTPGYTLNLRLGFTWNGFFPNPLTLVNPWEDRNLQSALYWYLRPKDPLFYPIPPATGLPNWSQNIITFNSYGDLVNSSCVRLYADFALASTQDSLGSSAAANTPTPDGLLSIVPVNASNLGVAFYQNNFNNPLTKIPQNIAEIGITMLTDQGLPYYLPNSATVLLELAIDYTS